MNKKILVLDDDEGIRELYKDILENKGYQITTVEDGQEGVEAVRKAFKEGNKFDLYLSDVRMPNLDGPGFYETIIKERINDSPIIFSSGGMSKKQKDRLTALNPAAFLEKPCDIHTILSTVEYALNSKTDNIEKHL